jgi:hypothetical protein
MTNTKGFTCGRVLSAMFLTGAILHGCAASAQTAASGADAPLSAAEQAQLERLGRGEVELMPATPPATPTAPALWWDTPHPELDSDTIRYYCRVGAAALFPNLLDAYENELRMKTYADCVTAQGRPLAPPQHGVDGLVSSHTRDLAMRELCTPSPGSPAKTASAAIICNSAVLLQLVRDDFDLVDRLQSVLSASDFSASMANARKDPGLEATCGVIATPAVEACYAEHLRVRGEWLRQQWLAAATRDGRIINGAPQ